MSKHFRWSRPLRHVPAECEYYPSQDEMPAEALAAMEQRAYDFGESYDAYLATEDDREYFWSPGRRGVIGFVRWGRALNVLGGLLAAPDDQDQLLNCFVEFAKRNRVTVNFIMITPTQAPVFRRHGFRISKCGEELFVLLQQVNWQGKDYQWLRRQENACIRNGLRVEEIDPYDDPARFRENILPQLGEVNAEHLAGTLHGRELVFYEGRFTPWTLNRRRLWVAWQANRIEAFVVCNPALGGDMWAIEIYRRRTAAPRGVIPYSMLQVMRQLKDEGVLYASLSSVPFLRCGWPVRNDDLRFQGACQFFWHSMNWLFDIRGIYHFKSRFRPVYREMSIATYPRSRLLSLISMLAVWELHRVSPWRLARHLMQYCQSRSHRALLAQPELRPERKIRHLRRTTQTQSPPARRIPISVSASPSPVEVAGSDCSVYQVSEA